MADFFTTLGAASSVIALAESGNKLAKKQQMWWNEKEKVKNHYLAGEYNELIREIELSKGQQHFHHEIVIHKTKLISY